MAGSSLHLEAAPRRSWVRCLAVAVGIALTALMAGSSAMAQVPPLPDGVPPDVPPAVTDALAQVEDVVIPVLVDAAVQGQVVSSTVGFALRPGCAGAGTAVLLIVIAGGSLPVSPGFISTPLLIFCAGAFSPGPVDPVFQTVDDQAGDTLEDQAQPVIDQASAALDPVKPNLIDACGVIALAGSTPRQVPPPFNRFDMVHELCTPTS